MPILDQTGENKQVSTMLLVFNPICEYCSIYRAQANHIKFNKRR